MASESLSKGALWMQNVNYPASWDRALIDTLFIVEGVIDGFEVTPNGGLGIAVSAGRAVIQGDEVAGQGKYLIDQDAVVTLTLSSVGTDRTEYVYIAVNDPAVAGGRAGNNVTIETSTSPPPDSALLLATISLTSGTSTITAGMISDDRTITGVVTPNSITDLQLAADSVGTEELKPSAVGTGEIADGSITAAKLAPGAVAAGGLADGSIGTAKLADDAVTKPKIGPGAVGATELDSDAVTQSKIGPGAVGPTEITSAAVTNAKIADGAVSAAKLGTWSVTGTKIADSAVTNSKIDDSAVTGTKIANGSINSQHYADESVDERHLSNLLSLTVVTSLLNGWTGTVRYGRVGNIGFLFADVNGSSASQQTILTLPVGFRPTFYTVWAADGAATDGAWCGTDGQVKSLTGGAYLRIAAIYQAA